MVALTIKLVLYESTLNMSEQHMLCDDPFTMEHFINVFLLNQALGITRFNNMNLSHAEALEKAILNSDEDDATKNKLSEGIAKIKKHLHSKWSGKTLDKETVYTIFNILEDYKFKWRYVVAIITYPRYRTELYNYVSKTPSLKN